MLLPSFAENPNKSVKLNSLTGLRFVAALSVFLFHSSLIGIIDFNPFENRRLAALFEHILVPSGWVAVSFFFILSGFVLTWSANPNEERSTYIWRRFLRIYPSHVVTWAAAMILYHISLTDRPDIYLANLLLIHAWIPHLENLISVNGTSWSLAVEIFFYSSFPFVAPMLWRIPARHLWTAVLLCCAALLIAHVLVSTYAPNAPVVPQHPISVWSWYWLYFFPPLRIFEFIIGILIARIVIARAWIDIGIPLCVSIFCLSYILCFYVPFHYTLNLMTIMPIALLVGCYAFKDLSGKKGILSSKVMVKAGELSFGFYLTHLIVLNYMRKLLGDQRYDVFDSIMLILLAFSLSLVSAWVLHTYVELPFVRRWGLRRASMAPPLSIPDVKVGP